MCVCMMIKPFSPEHVDTGAGRTRGTESWGVLDNPLSTCNSNTEMKYHTLQLS